MIKLYPPLTTDNTSGIFIFVSPSNGRSLNNIVSLSMGGYKAFQNVTGFRLIQLNATHHELTDSLAYMILSDFRARQNHTQLEVYLLMHNTVYNFVYKEESSNFYSYLPTVLKILYSFGFVGSEVNFGTVSVIQNIKVDYNTEAIDMNPNNQLMIVTHPATLTFLNGKN